MSNLINIDDLLELGFVIPNSNDLSVSERVEDIITYNERLIIEAILGMPTTEFLYLELENGTPPEDRVLYLWNGISTPDYRFRGLKIAVASLIYFLLIEDRILYLSASGVMSSVSENSTVIDPNSMMNTYFNNYVRFRNSVKDYLIETDDFQDWDITDFKNVSIRSDYNF